MTVENREIRVNGRRGPRPGVSFEEEPRLGELFRQLADDAVRLVRQEVTLAKTELRETGVALARDSMKIGIALAMALLGAMAGTAFLILLLGQLIGNFWLSALAVTIVYLIIAGVLARSAINGLKQRDLRPTQTIETLREDAVWAKNEVTEVKRGAMNDGNGGE